MPIALLKRLNTYSRIQFEMLNLKLLLEPARYDSYFLFVVFTRWLKIEISLFSHFILSLGSHIPKDCVAMLVDI